MQSCSQLQLALLQASQGQQMPQSLHPHRRPPVTSSRRGRFLFWGAPQQYPGTARVHSVQIQDAVLPLLLLAWVPPSIPWCIDSVSAGSWRRGSLRCILP